MVAATPKKKPVPPVAPNTGHKSRLPITKTPGKVRNSVRSPFGTGQTTIGYTGSYSITRSVRRCFTQSSEGYTQTDRLPSHTLSVCLSFQTSSGDSPCFSCTLHLHFQPRSTLRSKSPALATQEREHAQRERFSPRKSISTRPEQLVQGGG